MDIQEQAAVAAAKAAVGEAVKIVLAKAAEQQERDNATLVRLSARLDQLEAATREQRAWSGLVEQLRDGV